MFLFKFKMMKFNIIIVRIALCLTVLLNRGECVNVKCEKIDSNGVAIKTSKEK